MSSAFESTGIRYNRFVVLRVTISTPGNLAPWPIPILALCCPAKNTVSLLKQRSVKHTNSIDYVKSLRKNGAKYKRAHSFHCELVLVWDFRISLFRSTKPTHRKKRSSHSCWNVLQ